MGDPLCDSGQFLGVGASEGTAAFDWNASCSFAGAGVAVHSEDPAAAALPEFTADHLRYPADYAGHGAMGAVPQDGPFVA